jgi:hypothetical protein
MEARTTADAALTLRFTVTYLFEETLCGSLLLTRTGAGDATYSGNENFI